MRKFERFLVQTALFLIPSNLAYHWYVDSAYINGHLIDYLLPRLYLSDLPIFILMLLNLNRFTSFLNRKSYLLPLISYLILNTLFIHPSLSSFWFLLKLIELTWFTLYLRSNYPKHQLLNIAFWPLMFSMLLQFLIASLQYINQSEIFGYLLLGEPHLGGVVGLGQSMLPGTLKILAYGTTSHPNVLAGFFVVAMLVCWQSYFNNPKLTKRLYPLIITTGLSIVIMILTESVSGVLAVIWSMAHLERKKSLIIRYGLNLLSMIILVSSLVILLPSTISHYHSPQWINFKSITIRYKLNQHAFTLINEIPFFGVGLNQFTPSLIEHNLLDTAPFIQPAHQVLLLWLSETGLIGFLLVIWLILRLKSRAIPIPLLALVIIGLFDHYPLTLQTGQLLLFLCLSII
jgi:hypothetical protein